MTGSLLIRALERSERIYVSMLSRGYDGETRALPQAPMTTRSWSVLAASLILLALLLLFATVVLR
jgi:cobalt/nickel transport system permease protein